VGMAISAERSPFEPFSLPKVVNQVVNQGVQLVNRRSHPPESCESMAKSDREKTAKLGGAVTPGSVLGAIHASRSEPEMPSIHNTWPKT